MPAGTVRSNRPYIPVRRGTHGYAGGSVDAQNDPAPVIPRGDPLPPVGDEGEVIGVVSGAWDATVAPGGEQTITLHKHTINWDDPGFGGEGEALGGPLPVNAVVVALWAVVTEVWDGAGAVTLQLGLCEGDPAVTFNTLPLRFFVDLDAGDGVSAGLWAERAKVFDNTEVPALLLQGSITKETVILGADIRLYAAVNGGPLVGGQADVYALIAEPAA